MVLFLFNVALPAESLNVRLVENKIVLQWKAPQIKVKKYEIYRIDDKHTKENPLFLGETQNTEFIDTMIKPNVNYSYLIRTYIDDTSYADTDWSGFVSLAQKPNSEPKAWFDIKKLPILVFLIVFTLLFFFYYYQARLGKVPYIRKIAGLEAIDDAVGRATEMGRPIIYTTLFIQRV